MTLATCCPGPSGTVALMMEMRRSRCRKSGSSVGQRNLVFEVCHQPVHHFAPHLQDQPAPNLLLTCRKSSSVGCRSSNLRRSAAPAGPRI